MGNPMAELINLDEYDAAALLAEVRKCGGQRAFSRKYGVPRTTLQDRLYKLRADPFQDRPRPEAVVVGQGTGRRRFICTSAQDGTRVHESFLTNLEAYADWLGQDAPCEIIIAGFTYNKGLFEDHSKGRSPIFHARVQPYLRNERMRLCEGLDFCGEQNTLPTAERPLSDFQTYTRERWGIFPHAKVQLVSVATQKASPTKIIMTTGAVTKSNYVQKRAGIKASFHHQIAAVLVEIDDDEEFFCRHLIADDDDGAFYDLDRYVNDGEVTEGHAVECLTPGDIHVAQIDPEVSRATFAFWPTGERAADSGWIWDRELNGTSIIERLRPEHIFVHDVSDFRARNHHDIADPHVRFKLHVNGVETVEDELQQDAMFLSVLKETSASNVHVVESNHHQAFIKWLKSADFKTDPANALFYLRCQTACYEAMDAGLDDFDIYVHVMKSHFPAWRCEGINFLREDQKFVLGRVEHANHGHRGANGARGNIQAFIRLGSKVTIGHTHSAAILDGVYVAGTTSKLDLKYNVGPSSWSHSHVVQYKSGKRAIITLKGGRWTI
jgi:hypothetical protein